MLAQLAGYYSQDVQLAEIIAALYSAGEQGALYQADPFYWYQYRAGNTPVTVPDQTIGLSLDVSRGLELGPELGNGANLDKRPATDGMVTRTDGVISFVSSASGLSTGVSEEIAGLVVGRYYVFEADVRYVAGITNAGVTVRSGSGGGGSGLSEFVSTVSVAFVRLRVMWRATQTSAHFTIQAQALSSSTFDVLEDSYSVRELPGNHAVAQNDAGRPLARAVPWRVDYDGVDDYLRTVFPNLGTACTVGRSVPGVGASILTGQTINGNYDDSTDHAGLVIVDRALTADETDLLTRWLNQQAGV